MALADTLYRPGRTSDLLDTDLEGESDSNGASAVATHGVLRKYIKLLPAVMLLVGAICIYSVTGSPPEAMRTQQANDKTGIEGLYEVAGGEDSTASPDSTAPP